MKKPYQPPDGITMFTDRGLRSYTEIMQDTVFWRETIFKPRTWGEIRDIFRGLTSEPE